MGLYAWEIELIAKLPLPEGFSTLSFGHPDILATSDELYRIVGGFRLPIDNECLDRAKFPPDVVGNARIVFGALGSQMTILDFRNGFNVDEIGDLNYPFTPTLHGKFDLVIDPGTSEHCFNVGQALVNMASCVKDGGFIYHRVPLAHWNHGFWNFSPCAFHDFYTQNGFELTLIGAESKGQLQDVQVRKGGTKWKIPNDGRKLQLVCIAHRVTRQEIKFPTQYKYLET